MNLDGLEPWGGLQVTGGEADVAVAGIPYDGSAVYRKGAALAPGRIRAMSAVVPPVTEAGRRLSGLRVHDLGDLDAGVDIERGWRAPADRLAQVPASTFLTVIGGDHCTAISTLQAQARRHPGLGVLMVDAHPDLCDFSRGGRWTCGCAMRRALEVSAIDPKRVVIAAGRDYDPEELDFIDSHEMLLVSARDLTRDFGASVERIGERLAGLKVHISFDIDALDPAFAPGTEIPCAGGITTREALELLTVAAEQTQIVGLDVVEVAPPFDTGDITTLAALKLIFEVWGMAWQGQGQGAGQDAGQDAGKDAGKDAGGMASSWTRG